MFPLHPWSDVICLCEKFFKVNSSKHEKSNQSHLLNAFMHALVGLHWFGVKDKTWILINNNKNKKHLETNFFSFLIIFYKLLLMAWRPFTAFSTYNKKERVKETKKLKSFTLIRSHHQEGQKYDNIWHAILSFFTVIYSFEMEVHRDIESVWSKILKILLVGYLNPFLPWCYFRNLV